MPPQQAEGRGRRSVDDTLAFDGVAMLVLAKVPCCFDGWNSGSGSPWELGGGVFCALWFRRGRTDSDDRASCGYYWDREGSVPPMDKA
mmetsp:Transcript_18873/g.44236  ORF Transcript_18873/g.44236 Transcript_18873/m.44236 type:complete len:88 (-) Transcript_18873:146-409(-)